MVRNACASALAVCAVLSCATVNAAVKAFVERTTFPVTDSVRVVFETDQEVSGRPDWSALDADFDVLGSAQSTSINFVNGRIRRSAIWTVDLMARREGVLTIPSIRIGAELTRPITLNVQASATDAGGMPVGDVFLEVEVDDESPYVQGQFVFTIRLFRRVQMGNASLTEPAVSGGEVIVERLGDDVGYETKRGGTTFAVVERRYAMFAQSSGSVVIEPLLFEGRVAGRAQSVFDPFTRGRVVRARSRPVEVEIRPIPSGFAGKVWLPARQVLLLESAPEGNRAFRVGEPVTRTLTLRANGLAANQLPEIDARVPDGIKQYPDQPVFQSRVDEDGVVGIRQQKVALIPSRAGTLTLPAIDVPWWNTRTDRLEHARLPERVIEVLPASGTPAGQQAPGELLSAERDETASSAGPQPAGSTPPGPWMWISAGLGIGWVATTLLWLRSRRRRPTHEPVSTRPSNERQLVGALEQACKAGEAASAKDALLEWATLQWPGSRVRSLGQLAARLDGDLQQRIHALSRMLYSEPASGWDGAPLWLAFEARTRERTPHVPPRAPELEPLYLHE